MPSRCIAVAFAALTLLCCSRPSNVDLEVVVLGIDGLDYAMTRDLMAAGRLPNFQRLAESGGFSALGTTVPPQSPVAWSSFITGLDPGGHGIFDFLHRDPETMLPTTSTTHTEGGDRHLELGKWKVPLSAGAIESLRRGTPFWEVLEENGIETTILRMPANYPPSGTATRELSGMGTPDLTGTDGTFSFYTSELFAFAGQEMSGNIYELDVYDNVVETNLYGPDNPFLLEPEKLAAPFTVFLDPEQSAAKIELGSQQVVLSVGEWSDWLEVEFVMVPVLGDDICVPGLCLRGICRMYLKQLEPEFELYVTPIDHDPMAPAMPVSTPDDFAAELAAATGRFHTEGMPEDTKTLTEGVFEPKEFLSQAANAGQEVIDQFYWVFDRFERGLLFYYFGNVDQISHVMFRSLDPGHPAYDAERDAPYADLIPSLYEQMDGIVGYTLDNMDEEETLLVVMSDHGFAPWRRVFHLNNWLRDNGYLALEDPDTTSDPGLLLGVDWSRTRAYGLGFNGLYVNLEGREREGIVSVTEREPLLHEIADKLLAEIDPATELPAITKAHVREEVYRDRGAIEIGPDLLIGYARGVRPSNESALGEFTDEVLSDNESEWSGDHMMDFEEVPGILLTSRPLRRPAGRIHDLAASILYELGVEGFPRGEP